MQEEATTKTEETSKVTKSTVNGEITKTVSEDNKSLFNFKKRQLLEEGFTMIGEVQEESIKSFWDFWIGSKVVYTATFRKKI